MNKVIETIKFCRLCSSPQLRTVLDFGECPLANSYPKNKEDIEEFYRLSVCLCDSCGHVQLRQTIRPDVLFSNYLYASSDSPSLRSHFKAYARDIVSKFKVGENTKILEIGCNDGILLEEFQNLGLYNLVGVEPAVNIANIALFKTKLPIYNCFFNLGSSIKIGDKEGKFDVICANNVFAHVADLDSLMMGIKYLLTKDGVFIFENAYLLDTITNLYFDQIYHEHLQYYGIKPLVGFFRSYDMEIVDVQHVKTQGGSIRVFVKKMGDFISPLSNSVRQFIEAEEDFELYKPNTYVKFKEKLAELYRKVHDFIDMKGIVSGDKTLSCYGCPAKFALFSKYFNLTKEYVKYVVDDSPLKQGRFAPGSKIPIVSRDHFIENPTDYCIISVWNMAQSIINRNSQYRGGFIIPMPEFDVINNLCT